MKRRLGFGLVLAAGVALVACLGLAVWSGVLYWILPESHVTAEWLMGQTPERRVSAYLGAIARQDRQDALAAWPLRDGATPELRERRESVTDELLAMGAGLRYDVVGVEWWRNCCEPGPIDSPGNAGLARLHLALTGEEDSRVHYFVVDVGTAGSYWGPAGGDPIRRWRLLDVYLAGEEPLGFPWPRP